MKDIKPIDKITVSKPEVTLQTHTLALWYYTDGHSVVLHREYFSMN